MTSSTEMEFYLSKVIDEKDLINFWNKQLNIRLESLNHPDSKATAFLMMTTYDTGFTVDINVSYQQPTIPKINHLSVAKLLAQHYNMIVVTDLPNDDQDRLDPYYWCLVQPEGLLSKVKQDISASENTESLILDISSKQSLKLNQVLNL